MVFTDKTLEDCLDEIGFDKGRVIKIEAVFDDYQRKHMRMIGIKPYKFKKLNQPWKYISWDVREEVYKRIINGESFRSTYTEDVSLNSYVKAMEHITLAVFVLKQARRFEDLPNIGFFSELLSNTVGWGNGAKYNGGSKPLQVRIWATNNGSVLGLTQKNEWDYKKVVQVFENGGKMTSRRGDGGCGMEVLKEEAYEVGYAKKGKFTYVLVKEEKSQ